MIHLTNETRILLATQPSDFRKGIDGFVALCRQQLEQDPRSRIRFVFINKSRTMIRVLTWDGSGFWLMTKRLSRNRFQGWPAGVDKVTPFSARQLSLLIRGEPGRPVTLAA